MNDTERPRRTRRPVSGGTSLPLVPVLAGVVILGLAFGAGLSVFLQRNTNAPVVIVTAAPLVTPTPAQRVVRTSPKLSPPKGSPTPRLPETAQMSPTPAAIAPSPLASATPQAPRVAIVTPAPAVTSPPTLTPRATPAVIRITPVPATRPPYVVPEGPPQPPGPVPALRTPPTPAPIDEADSEFARLSASVVRSYLNALARGDDASARSVLDGPRGSPALRLTEKEFTDQSLHIVKLDAHGTNDSATVNVDLNTYKGAYFEQFSLRRLPTGAAVIIEHTFIRP